MRTRLGTQHRLSFQEAEHGYHFLERDRPEALQMTAKAAFNRLFRRGKPTPTKRKQPATEGEQARDIEKLIASGLAGNKFPPSR